MSKSEIFQGAGDFFTHPKSVSTEDDQAEPVPQRKEKAEENYNIRTKNKERLKCKKEQENTRVEV